MKVRATNVYEQKHIEDAELKRIPKAGEEWEVSEERYNQLMNNVYGLKFVESFEVETAVKSPVVEKAVKKTTKKK